MARISEHTRAARQLTTEAERAARAVRAIPATPRMQAGSERRIIGAIRELRPSAVRRRTAPATESLSSLFARAPVAATPERIL